MRVGVTGATGFIGKYLIRDYQGQYEFVAPVRNISTITRLYTGVRYVQSDFSVDSLKNIFQGCDAVIHLAGVIQPKTSGSMKAIQFYLPNIVLAANVFEACRQLKIQNVVYSSTNVTWGEKVAQHVITEELPAIPSDEYGISKLCGDDIALFYNNTYDMKIKCLRLVEVFGLDFDRGMLNRFWNILFTKCLQGESIPLYGTGSCGRDLIYVKDVAKALITATHKNVCGIYNIGMGQFYSNCKIAETFCKIFQNSAGLQFHPEKAEWGNLHLLDASKAKNELGFKVEYDLESAIRDIQTEYFQMKEGFSE